ncbi:uncharacterized protein [Triticum aestivum]|uniref:uncharacterized protein n=1 Tax=Triticum aestivum TaxID=4565 RepID=UPI000E7BD899|nr:uncharacterized protein LOC123122199 [Triticum aestivum]
MEDKDPSLLPTDHSQTIPLHLPEEHEKEMEPLLMKGCRTSGGAGQGKLKPAAAWRLGDISEIISVWCMKTAIALACVYLVFLSYVAVTYTPSWAEKLRLSPLFLFATIVLLFGALMIRDKQDGCGRNTQCVLMEYQPRL